MTYTLEQLIEQTEKIANGALTWVSNDTFSIGIDWENEEMYIIDLEHPDGAVIESSNLMINRVWDEDTYPLPTQTTEPATSGEEL